MNAIHTYEQCATDWALVEYVDPNAAMTREEFDTLSVAEKIASGRSRRSGRKSAADE